MTVLLGEPLDRWRTRERLRLAHPDRRVRLDRSLRRYLAFALASRKAAWPDSALRLENNIIETIVLNAAIPEVRSPRPQRLNLAKQAEDYLRAHADTPVSLMRLCETIGINQRTLFLGFHERFGISPKAYLKILRLNGARRELLRPKPGISVTQVAMNWGFFHLGRFSIEYRAMFCESPIQTLKKGRSGDRTAPSTTWSYASTGR
jgi:AraC-like DNA-binding protein